MNAPVSRNVLVVCITVLMAFAMTAIVGVDIANRSTGQIAQQLIGLLGAAIPGIGAIAGIDKLRTAVKDVKTLVNGHLDSHMQQTQAAVSELTKVDPGNQLLSDIKDAAIAPEVP